MGKKFEIDADFTPQDLEVILDAVDEWESRDMELIGLIEKLKLIPDPPDDYESREVFLEFKKHMLGQEQKAKETKKLRRERATLLKAKLILMNQRKAADRMMEEAQEGE